MNRDSRLSATLHALLHMARQAETDPHRPLTSKDLAACMRTNPVVVRRTMAGLRQAGLVTSEKGPGGGWRIARCLDSVTLRDVYQALGAPTVMAMRLQIENPDCLVEKVVNEALDDAFREAEALLIARFGEVRLSGLARAFAERLPDTSHRELYHDE